MKVVRLEGLGVSDQVIERHRKKLETMGHAFTVYPKNTDGGLDCTLNNQLS